MKVQALGQSEQFPDDSEYLKIHIRALFFRCGIPVVLVKYVHNERNRIRQLTALW